jgi:Holliday junction resolvase RusA-like endonuclease
VSDVIRFEIPGPPVPWARARRNGGRYFPAHEVVEQQEAVRAAWMEAGRPAAEDGDAISIALTFYLPRPTSHYRTGRYAHLLRDDAPARPTCKPDIDNLQKLVLDALNTLLYRDDSQVVCVAAAGKHWATDLDPPRTVVQAWVASSPRLTVRRDP